MPSTTSKLTPHERTTLLQGHAIPHVLKHHVHQHQHHQQNAHSTSSSHSLPVLSSSLSSNNLMIDSSSSSSSYSKPHVMFDPKDHLNNAFHLAGLVNDHGGEYEKYRMTTEKLKKIKKKKIRNFYERQNSILDYFKEIDDILDNSRRNSRLTSTISITNLHTSNTITNTNTGYNQLESGISDIDNDIDNNVDDGVSDLRDSRSSSTVKFMINVNFFINFLLLVGKILVALLSNSISLIASLVDSAMDFLSTAIIWWTNRTIDSKSWQSIWHYPVGKRRMEPMGIVVFSVFMISSFVQVLVESIERLFVGSASIIPLTSILVMLITILVKGLVWIWCRRNKNSSVKALAQDAENDCVLNIFSLLFPYLGLKLNLPWLDAVGGLILSLYIIIEWSGTLFDNVRNLTGRRADPIQHQRVAYLVTRFSPLIQAVQHCHVYQAGDDFIVETDVILSPDTSLPVAHDVGEAVQYALESLDGISRAYCHVDFSSNPMSGHFQR